MPKRDTFYGAVATGGLEGVKKKKEKKMSVDSQHLTHLGTSRCVM